MGYWIHSASQEQRARLTEIMSKYDARCDRCGEPATHCGRDYAEVRAEWPRLGFVEPVRNGCDRHPVRRGRKVVPARRCGRDLVAPGQCFYKDCCGGRP